MARHVKLLMLAVALLALPLSPAMGKDTAGAAVQVGTETGLPIPRYVSMKANEGYARRGPSHNHRIDWVYKRRNVPVRIVDEYGHWRRVQDVDGEGGWMHYSLLSGNRTVIIRSPFAELRRRPDPAAQISARLEEGVIAWLGECAGGWCRVELDRVRGWALTSDLWGVAPYEVRE